MKAYFLIFFIFNFIIIALATDTSGIYHKIPSFHFTIAFFNKVLINNYSSSQTRSSSLRSSFFTLFFLRAIVSLP